MSKALYDSLIAEFCGLFGLQDAAHIAKGGPFAVGEVVFSLVHSDQGQRSELALMCDFGVAPAEKEAEVYRAVLEANAYLEPDVGPAFSVYAENGHVLFCNRYDVVDMTAVMLGEVLEELSKQALQWRQNYFLDQPLSTENHAVPQMWQSV